MLDRRHSLASPLDQYEEAETVMRVRQRGGKNASMFLTMPMLRARWMT